MKKSERLNQELIYLTRKREFNIKDLMDEFNISKRTALRDLEELEQLGFSFYVEQGRYGGYKVISEEIITPINFTTDELTAIFFALKSLEKLSQSPFEKNYKQIFEKLVTTLSPTKQREISKVMNIVNYISLPSITNEKYLKQLLDTALNSSCLNIEYKQKSYIETTLYIYDLFFRNGVWFFNGYDIKNKEWNIYRTDKILSCSTSMVVTPFATRKEAKDSLENKRKSFHNVPFKCQLTKAGTETFLKNKFPEMKLDMINNIPHIIGSFNKSELDYLTQYLLSFGQNIKILEPDFLRKNYVNSLRNILKNYE